MLETGVVVRSDSMRTLQYEAGVNEANENQNVAGRDLLPIEAVR